MRSYKHRCKKYKLCYKEKTQSQVAKILGITQVQVSRIERKILNSMKLKLMHN